VIDEEGLGGQDGFLRPGFAMLRGVCVQNPSPLGLSNYDALDEDDGWVEVENDEDEEAESCLPHFDFGLPQSTEQPVSVAEEMEEEEEEHVQPEEEKKKEEEEEEEEEDERRNCDLNLLGQPARSPNFVGGDVEEIRSPNREWFALTLRRNMANEALASIGFMGKPLPACRQDALVEIKREQERQRRLLHLQLG